MEEKRVENYLVRQVKERGGLCLKFVSPSMAGVPDRIVLLPKGRIFFAELKAKGKKPRALQSAVHRIFKRLGFKVFVIDCKEQADKAIEEAAGIEIRTS